MGDFISTSETARRLGVTVRRVQELVGSGQLEAEKVSGVWLVSSDSVEHRMKTVNKSGGRPRRGMGRNEQSFTLMNRTHEIADVVYGQARREFSHFGELIDGKRAPIGIAPAESSVSLPDFNRWWRGRGIPDTRDNVDQVLREAGAQVPEELLQRNLGLSLSDQYWIRPRGSGLAWGDVNFSHNDFEAVAQRTASVSARPEMRAHPANTSDGDLEKTWVVRAGKRMLLKSGRHNNQEPFNEVAATALHRRLLDDRDYVAYGLEGEGLNARSSCLNFVSDDEEYIPATYVMRALGESAGRNEYQHYLACCESLGARGVKELLDRMIVCDDLLANFDRHFRNFGIIRNVETLECRPAPIFDSGSSLWCNINLDELEGGQRSFSSRQFYENPGRQLLLVDDYSWFNVSALDGFLDEAMAVLEQNEALEARLPFVRAALQWRLDRIIDIAEWS